MGHLPNKARKEAERAQLEAKQRAKQKPSPRLPTCRCGLTYLEVPIMWSCQIDRRSESELFCPACLPAKLIPVVARDVARLPDDQ
jgi:hypothetical protein